MSRRPRNAPPRALLSVVLLLTLAACSPPPLSPPKLVVVGWDGAPAWVIDRLLEEGELPGLARLAREGARAEYVTPGYPSITGQGWAALWSGAYGDVTGVTGNTIPLLPRSEHTLLESRNGLNANRSDSIWMAAMRDGRRVLSLGTSGLGPEEELRAQMEAYGIPLDRLQSYTRFQGSIAGERVMNETMLVAAEGWQGVSLGETAAREFSFTVGDSEFYGLVLAGGGPNRVAVCVETRDLGDASSCDELEAGGEGDDLDRWSRPFAVTSGNLVGRAYFRLFELTPDGSRMIFYQRSVSGIRNPTDDQEAFLDDVGGLGAGLGYGIYRAGELGATLAEGGEGAAETRLVELARFNAGLWVRAIRAGLDRYAPDVLTTYEDATDSAGHAWVGVLDPRSPMFDATLADAIWPSYVEIFKLQDEVLLDVLDRVDGNTIVTVVSDHGMSGIGKAFSANAVLEDAGLVFRDEDGMVDLSRTAIYGAWGSDYFLNVNSTDWKDGIVEPDEIEDVLDQATEALLSVIDPDTGQHVVTRVFRSDEIVALGMGGEAGGDLYMDFAYGYVPVDDPSPVLRPSAFAMGAGTHGFYPHRKEMQTIWFARGAGILPGQVLSPLRQIDIAPTLATLAGFGIPADARGHVIGELVR